MSSELHPETRSYSEDPRDSRPVGAAPVSSPSPGENNDPISELADSLSSAASAASTEASPETVSAAVPRLDSNALPPGTMLGHFSVSKYIGGGGMGSVYLGIDKSLDRKVAIKVLQKQRAQDQSSAARFMNEARSAARLNHEHIAQVYFAGQQDDLPFIAFEYVEGTNIRLMVEKYGVFPVSQAITFMIQIAHALNHAALHGVIHRDVKPSNILITKEGRAKLIDMGLARLLKPTDPGDDLTASGVTLGTFDYISPEQARDPRNADIRSDIYSLGCTLFFMLTGQPPFPEGTVLQKLLQHQGDEPPDVREFQPGIPAEIAQLVQKMMAKDPRQRFQTPAALLRSLTEVAGMLGLRPTGPGNTVWVLKPVSKPSFFLRHLPWISGVVLLLASVFGINIYWKDVQLPIPPLTVPEEQAGTASNFGTSPDSPQEPFSQQSASHQQGEIKTDRDEFVPVLREIGDWNSNAAASERIDESASLSGNLRFFARGFSLGSRPVSSSIVFRSPKHARSSLNASLNPLRKGQEAVPADQQDNRTTSLLVVDPSASSSEEGIFSTLAAAVAASGKNAMIELRFNGREQESGKTVPLSLAGRQLTIQAGKGYSPILSFAPKDPSFVKSGKIYFFLANGGELRFNRIAFEMDVSSKVLASQWSVFDILGPTQMSFSECSLTIRNTTSPESNLVYISDVAFFRIVPSGSSESSASGGQPVPGSSSGSPLNPSSSAVSGVVPEPGRIEGGDYTSPDSLSLRPKGATLNVVSGLGDGNRPDNRGITASGEAEEGQTVRIGIKDCILRGEATVLLCETHRPTKLELSDAFVAIALPFLVAREVKKETAKEGRVQIVLDHVSLFGKAALSRQIKEKETDAYPSFVKWTTRFSILRLNKKPIAEFFGFTSREEAFSLFDWQCDTNFLQDVNSGAEIKLTPSAYPLEISLEDWAAKWRCNPTVGSDFFQSYLPEQKLINTMVPGDLAITQRENNPAYKSVPKSDENRTESIDAGQLLPLLQKVPLGP